MAAPLLYHAWVGASMAVLPFFARREMRKLRAAGLSRDRAREKLGHASVPRPEADPLIWFHAASVGESLSVLALITRIGTALPRAAFVITSGTATSAALIAARLPPRTQHQFAPLDAPGPMRRFLRHWRPDAAVFVESELWPQMLRRTHSFGAKMALVNARLSEKSVASWRKKPKLSAYLFDVFDLILTQNDAMSAALDSLGAPKDRIARGINLKSMSDPLPVDQATLEKTRNALGDRPIWVASSTHEGEEEAALAAHQRLLKTYPDAHLILAPRHPHRGDAVARVIDTTGLSMTRRSAGQQAGGAVYLADTMGELGTWYALTDVVFLGGSLRPIGGHNPFEVAQSGAFALSGTHVFNFAETYAEMEIAGAASFVADADDLSAQLTTLLGDTAARARANAAAAGFAAQQTDRLDSIAARLITALELTP